MPRMQVYLPDDLYKLVKKKRLPASELLQDAVRAEGRRREPRDCDGEAVEPKRVRPGREAGSRQRERARERAARRRDRRRGRLP